MHAGPLSIALPILSPPAGNKEIRRNYGREKLLRTNSVAPELYDHTGYARIPLSYDKIRQEQFPTTALPRCRATVAITTAKSWGWV